MVLHGAFMTIGAMGAFVPALAEARQVVAVELQGHGHTADVDRPLSYEQMADDVAALLRHLGIEQADVFGYSMGGGAALQLAMRHPALVRKLVVASASSTSDGVYPEVWAGIEQITPELFAGTPWKEEYDRVAPNPDAFPTLVEKMKQLDGQPFAWPPDEIRAISAPTMVVIGDSDGTDSGARRRAIPPARRWRLRRPGRAAERPPRRPPRHHPRRAHRPRRLAGPDDRRVPRRAGTRGGLIQRVRFSG